MLTNSISWGGRMRILKDHYQLPKDFPFLIGDGVIEFHKKGEDPYCHWHECLEITMIKSGTGGYYNIQQL